MRKPKNGVVLCGAMGGYGGYVIGPALWHQSFFADGLTGGGTSGTLIRIGDGSGR
jgi:hypothetical protein